MAVHSSRKSILVTTGLALVLASSTGCGFFRRIAGSDTVDLKKAQVDSMSVDLRRSQKTICPREPVQMAVFAKVTLEGEKQAKDIETWQGKHGANKNDKMEFADFAFHSEQGNFDEDGWFAPNPNLLATASKEFEIKSVFKQRPDKFSFSTTYKPDYTCIKQAGKSGGGGQQGQAGPGGEAGRAGSEGGQGGSGSPGGQGANGTDGQPGPHLTAYATMVKTPFYEKLVAVRISGDYEDFVLVPEGQPFTLRAPGGSGGAGGNGGSGGRGGSGGSAAYVGGAGGQGANGGSGGMGGNGAAGGSIDLVVDSRYPDLAKAIALEAPGGEAGPPGAAGQGGAAGSGGSGTGQGGKRGPDGAAGAHGAPGSGGRRGPDGRVSAKAGSVLEQFGGLTEGVAVLGTEQPAAAVAGADAPADAQDAVKGKPTAKAANAKGAKKKPKGK